MEALFGDAASSDVDVYVYNGPSTTSTLFPLHKFPLLARSSLFRAYFTAFPDPGAGPASSAALRALFGAKEDFSSLIQPAERGERGRYTVRFSYFPGGPESFGALARSLYGLPLPLTTQSLGPLYCGARVLGAPDACTLTEKALTEALSSPGDALVVLSTAVRMSPLPSSLLMDIEGRCIVAIAGDFRWSGGMSSLPVNAFTSIISAAVDRGAHRAEVEAAVSHYISANVMPTKEGSVTGGPPVGMSLQQCLPIIKLVAPITTIRFADALFPPLQALLSPLSPDQRHPVCETLSSTGYWECLSHTRIEEGFRSGVIPDRYLILALFAENRQLRKVHDILADKVDELTLALEEERSRKAATAFVSSVATLLEANTPSPSPLLPLSPSSPSPPDLSSSRPVPARRTTGRKTRKGKGRP